MVEAAAGRGESHRAVMTASIRPAWQATAIKSLGPRRWSSASERVSCTQRRCHQCYRKFGRVRQLRGFSTDYNHTSFVSTRPFHQPHGRLLHLYQTSRTNHWRHSEDLPKPQNFNPSRERCRPGKDPWCDAMVSAYRRYVLRQQNIVIKSILAVPYLD